MSYWREWVYAMNTLPATEVHTALFLKNVGFPNSKTETEIRLRNQLTSITKFSKVCGSARPPLAPRSSYISFLFILKQLDLIKRHIISLLHFALYFPFPTLYFFYYIQIVKWRNNNTTTTTNNNNNNKHNKHSSFFNWKKKIKTNTTQQSTNITNKVL